MRTYRAEDYISLSAKSQALLRETRALVEEELEPRAHELETLDDIPPDLVESMKKRGLFGLTLPASYGGAGLGTLEYALICEEFGRTAVAYHLRISMNNGLVARSLLYAGSEELNAKCLPRIARGEAICSFALTEPGAGSDAAAIETQARQEGDEWVLDGTKSFVTNGPIADLYVVAARTSTGTRDSDGVSLFLVDRGNPGLQVGPRQQFMGARGAPHGYVQLAGARVHCNHVIGRIGEAFQTIMRSLDFARLTIGARALGSAQLLLEMSVRRAKARYTFGKPLINRQAIQWMIADSATEISLAREFVYSSARRADNEEAINTDAAMVKMNCMETANRVADRAMQIHGGEGYSTELPIERFYRDLRGPRLWDGSMEMMRHIIAKRVAAEDGLTGRVMETQ